MKSKVITSEELGKWLATFHKYSTVEEYREKLHAVRCIFNAAEDEEFWNEVVDVTVKSLTEK